MSATIRMRPIRLTQQRRERSNEQQETRTIVAQQSPPAKNITQQTRSLRNNKQQRTRTKSAQHSPENAAQWKRVRRIVMHSPRPSARTGGGACHDPAALSTTPHHGATWPSPGDQPLRHLPTDPIIEPTHHRCGSQIPRTRVDRPARKSDRSARKSVDLGTIGWTNRSGSFDL